MNTTLQPIDSLLGTVRRVLALDESVFVAIQDAPHGLPLALTIVLFAGLSQELGQSVVLFVNRVTPRRFVASLLLSTLLFAFGFFFWTASVWLVSGYLFEQTVSYRQVSKAVGLGYAPYWFSFFVLTPYFGTLIATLLSLWSLLAILLALQVTLELTLLQALVGSALGWLLLQLSQRTIGRPVTRLTRALRSMIADRPLLEANNVGEILTASAKDPDADHEGKSRDPH